MKKIELDKIDKANIIMNYDNSKFIGDEDEMVIKLNKNFFSGKKILRIW